MDNIVYRMTLKKYTNMSSAHNTMTIITIIQLFYPNCYNFYFATVTM